MVVGPTGSGKSAVINILKGVEQAHAFCMNAKSITVNELYGTMDMVTREWKDGLLSKIFRVANEKPASGKEEARLFSYAYIFIYIYIYLFIHIFIHLFRIPSFKRLLLLLLIA